MPYHIKSYTGTAFLVILYCFWYVMPYHIKSYCIITWTSLLSVNVNIVTSLGCHALFTRMRRVHYV